jgi:two-component sensor histidine kinase
LAGAQSALLGPSADGASLIKILQTELGGIAPNAISISSCDVIVNAEAAQQFALIVHELATNAFKYGALSRPEGRITVSGQITESAQGKNLKLTWAECGGPPVTKPTRRGFGSSILFEATRQFGMTVEADFKPEGLVYTVSIDLEDIGPSVVHLVPPNGPVAQNAAVA